MPTPDIDTPPSAAPVSTVAYAGGGSSSAAVDGYSEDTPLDDLNPEVEETLTLSGDTDGNYLLRLAPSLANYPDMAQLFVAIYDGETFVVQQILEEGVRFTASDQMAFWTSAGLTLSTFMSGRVGIGVIEDDGANKLQVDGPIKGASEKLTDTTNQLVLGTTRTWTLSAPTPATASRTVTLRDFGADCVIAQATAGNNCFFTTVGATNVTLPTSGTLLSTTTALKDGSSGDIAAVVNGVYNIIYKAPYAGTITSLSHIVRTLTTAGTVKVQIDGVDVTGLTGIVPTTSGNTTAASAANTFTAGQSITLVFASTLAVVDFQYSLNYTRAP